MRPVMSIQLFISAVSMVLDHCQVSPVTPPSGSITAPVIVSPTCGAIVRASAPAHRVTSPISSTLVTVMVTVIMSLALSGSVAVTMTSTIGGLGLVVQGRQGHQLARFRVDVEAGARLVRPRCRSSVSPLASRAATRVRRCPSPAAVFSATVLLVVAEANSGATFASGALMISGSSSTSVTVIVTMMEALSPKESSAMTVTM